jgi:superfamily II DNA or RNA helicase/HKD family nuclease
MSGLAEAWASGDGLSLVDNRQSSAGEWLRRHLVDAHRVDICVAYVTKDGLQCLARELSHCLECGARVRLVTSAELGPSDAEALLQVVRHYPNTFHARVHPSGASFLHSKVYLLDTGQLIHLMVGSSNLTLGGLEQNIESNIAGNFPALSPLVHDWQESFEALWSQSLLLDQALDMLRPAVPKRGGVVMAEPGRSPVHPFPPGTAVVVHGERGKVLDAVDLGGGRFRYEILLEDSRQVQQWVSPPTDIRPWLGPLDLARTGHLSPALEHDLRVDALRLSLAYEYDRMVSLSGSRINLEPYQVEAVHRIVNSFPHRFLVADDTGLGKTIEAGMTLEELAARGRAERVLVVAPAGVCRNWRRELRSVFGRAYVPYDGPYLRALMERLPPEQNPWERDSKIIASLDLVKRDEVRVQLERTQWDVVIVDEAHKLSSRRYGSKVEETHRFRVGKALQERTDSLLLLSATPHSGDRYAFNALLSLVDEFAFPVENPELLDARHVGQITIRRVKKEILDEQGRPVFVDRRVSTVSVDYTEEEKALYSAVTRYVVEGYSAAKAEENRAVGFVMILFQKRMVSSVEAIKRSLERRLKALQDRMKGIDAGMPPLSSEERRRLEDYLEDPDSLEDQDKQELELRAETLVRDADRATLEGEIEQLKRLTRLASQVRVDSKGDRLMAFLRGVFEKDPSEKVLIFTEYKDTLDYLESRLVKEGWKTVIIHGGMGQDAREEALDRFEDEQTRILLATDAAGEGLNLHWKCHIMVDYELPWNPNRIEQRIGRLHRYGQRKEVHVYNLFVADTREDQILEKLLNRLSVIGQDLPGDVYDVLGALLDSVDLTDMVMSALTEGEEPEVTAEKAAEAAKERAAMLQRVEKELFMDIRGYDHSQSVALLDRVRHVSATSEDLRRFTEVFLGSRGARIAATRQPGVVRIRDVPPIVRKEGVFPAYERVTFDREIARQASPSELELVAFGHPLFDSVVHYCGSETLGFDGRATAKRVELRDQAGQCGVVFSFRIRCTDGRGDTAYEELFQAFVGEDGHVSTDLPADLPRYDQTERTTPELTDPHRRLVPRLDDLHQSALASARERARQVDEFVQDERTERVRAMKEDLDRYAGAREAHIRMRRATIEERVRQYRQQPQLLDTGQDLRILGEEARLRDLDTELEELRRKVTSRAELLGNMEIVVAERPELIAVALMDFV